MSRFEAVGNFVYEKGDRIGCTPAEAAVELARKLNAYQMRVERFKAEIESLSKPAIIGGYNISEYIRMANSETLEFDNGDMFADMTLPERIKYIVESHARLKAEVERLTQAAEWQPIQTAPKDGTRILIYCQVSGIVEAGWERAWLDRHNDYCDVCEVTHWMTLPSAPAKEVQS